MTKFPVIALVGVLLLSLLFSCKKEEDPYAPYVQWKADNIVAYDSWKNRSDVTVMTIPEDEGGGSYLIQKDSRFLPLPGGISPLFTDSIEVYYRGRLYNGTIFDSNFSGTSDTIDYEYCESRKFLVSGLVRGWIEAVQQMKVGEKWKVVLPQELGYGSQIQTSIPPYSMLEFDIQLVRVVRR